MIYIKVRWKLRCCDGPVAQDTRERAHDQNVLYHFIILYFVFSFPLKMQSTLIFWTSCAM